MLEIDMERLVPRFILNDKNGYALSKAIERGMNMLLETIQAGTDLILNVDTMPEWRLDEMTWETNCLYDYGAEIEAKRMWIKNAIPLYRLYGTPQAVRRYIGGYFDDIDVEESWVYRGEPYHFRVTVEGTWTPGNEAWARRAIETAKNVRSVLDSLRIGCKCRIAMTANGAVLARFHYPVTGEDRMTGLWPQEAMLGALDKGIRAAMEARAEGHAYPYDVTGTKPQTNMLGVVEAQETGISSETEAHPFAYAQTGDAQKTGMWPHVAMLGAIDESAHAGVEARAEGYAYPYDVTGTKPQANVLGAIETQETGICGETEAHPFVYVQTGETQKAGAWPQEAMIGETGRGEAAIDGSAEGIPFPYDAAGTIPQENTMGIPGETDIHAAQAADTYARIIYTMCGEDEF